MAPPCVNAVLLLALLGAASACSNKVEPSVRNASNLLTNTPGVWPMALYMAQEPSDARSYSCYVMDASFNITFYNSSTGNETFTISPTSAAASNETYRLTYNPPKKHMLGATQDNATVTLQVMALYADFVFWEACDNAQSRHFLFMKNGVDKENLDYRCLKKALQYTFSVAAVPKGVCA